MSDPDWVVFTDLDGTLLDHFDYSFSAAQPALQELRYRNIPWLFNTSKTFAELKQLRDELDNPWPLIVENGSAIAVPDNPECRRLFPQMEPGFSVVRKDGFLFYSLGLSRSEFLSRLAPLKQVFKFLGYQDMSLEKLMSLTGLNAQQARQSLDRQYTEPCVWMDTEQALQDFSEALKPLGLCCVRGGRFVHIMADSDKGRALKWVMNFWFAKKGCTSMALGDGENDLPMLNSADVAILVRSPVHQLPAPCTAKTVRVTEGFGPAGWSGAIIAILEESGTKTNNNHIQE